MPRHAVVPGTSVSFASRTQLNSTRLNSCCACSGSLFLSHGDRRLTVLQLLLLLLL
eukprot:jgi/Psemu1/312083/fgenesh1_kg.877_\